MLPAESSQRPTGRKVRRLSMRMSWRAASRWALALVAAGAVAGLPGPAAHAGPGMFNVRNFGATGNGSTFDDDAIDRAINAAASAGGGGTVVFPSGRYRSRSIHLKSNITLQLNAGSTIVASSSGIDAPEPNAFDEFQDFGHSHFHNALLWGERIANLSITGIGTFDGDGLVTGDAPRGVGDKILSLKRCTNLRVQDVTFRRGGHFAMLLNGCDGVRLNNVKVLSSNDRDAINLINSRNIEVANSRIEGSDDALVFKSDFALGETMVSQNVRVLVTDLHQDRRAAPLPGTPARRPHPQHHLRQHHRPQPHHAEGRAGR